MTCPVRIWWSDHPVGSLLVSELVRPPCAPKLVRFTARPLFPSHCPGHSELGSILSALNPDMLLVGGPEELRKKAGEGH